MDTSSHFVTKRANNWIARRRRARCYGTVEQVLGNWEELNNRTGVDGPGSSVSASPRATLPGSRQRNSRGRERGSVVNSPNSQTANRPNARQQQRACTLCSVIYKYIVQRGPLPCPRSPAKCNITPWQLRKASFTQKLGHCSDGSKTRLVLRWFTSPGRCAAQGHVRLPRGEAAVQVHDHQRERGAWAARAQGGGLS